MKRTLLFSVAYLSALAVGTLGMPSMSEAGDRHRGRSHHSSHRSGHHSGHHSSHHSGRGHLYSSGWGSGYYGYSRPHVVTGSCHCGTYHGGYHSGHHGGYHGGYGGGHISIGSGHHGGVHIDW